LARVKKLAEAQALREAHLSQSEAREELYYLAGWTILSLLG
jgi:hypothetical protein